MSVSSLLERLSQSSDTPLKTVPALGKEIVFVRADGVPLGDLKARLAEALTATWTKRQDGEYLGRTPAQEQVIWTDHIRQRRKQVDEALAAIKKELQTPFSAPKLVKGLAELKPREQFTDNPTEARRRYEAEKALFDSGALARFLRRLVLAANPNDLAAIGPFQRRIFRLKPTRMQFGFNRQAFDSAVAEFTKEQRAWIEAGRSANFPEESNGRMVSDPRAQLEFDPADAPAVELQVSRGEMAGLFFVNLIHVTEGSFNRQVAVQANFADSARRFLDSQMNPAPSSGSDPVVNLSQDSKEFHDALSGAYGGREFVPPSPRMLQLMTEVDKNDPLGWAPSDALTTYADHKKENMIAVLPDTAISVAWFLMRQGPMRAGQFMDGLLQSCNLQLKEENGWATVVPADRWEAFLDFTPRAAVSELMIAVISKGTLDIRDYARYAYKSGRINRMGLGDIWLAMYDRSVLSSMDRTDWNTLRLYGSLNTAQQRELENGNSFLLGGLTPDQRKIVEAIVYGGELRTGESQIDGSVSVTNIEPTEQFAAGLPASGTLGAKVVSQQVIVAYGKTETGRIRPLRSLNAATLATIEQDVVGNPQRMATYGVPNLVGYAPGLTKNVVMRITLAPGVWKESSFQVPDYDPNAKPVSWDKLPQREEIAAAMDQLKRQKQNGNTNPPPP